MKCLLIEDNKDLRNVVRLLIEAVGAVCLPAESVAAAMSLVESETGFTHFLTDWHVGTQPVSIVIDSARRLHPGISVAIYSGDSQARLDLGAMGGTNVFFFQKPISLEELSNWLKS